MPTKLVTVVETAVFVRQAAAIWDDTEREALVGFIAANPKLGDIIPGTGGVRQLTAVLKRKGK